MARSLEWRELKLGVLASVLVAAFAIGILFFARVGQMRGDLTTLYVYSNDAVGVLPGTEVWLSGEKIGQVKRIRFRPVETDTLRRLAIETQIMAQHMRQIRRNSRVDIRPGGNLIGTPIINITGGTSQAPALESGDTLAAMPWPRYYFDFEGIDLPVPVWDGVRPYEQIPFQWSCHIETSAGQLEHA